MNKKLYLKKGMSESNLLERQLRIYGLFQQKISFPAFKESFESRRLQ